MTSKSSKNFYIFGCTAIAIALVFVLSSCSDEPPAQKPEAPAEEAVNKETDKAVTETENQTPAEPATDAVEEVKEEAADKVADAAQTAEDAIEAVEEEANKAVTPPPAPAETAKKSGLNPAILNSLVEGTHYTTMFPDDTRAKEPVVVEFFSYMCPACFRMEGPLKKWLKTNKPEDVKFVKIPLPGSELYTRVAKAHFIAEKLRLMDTFPDRMFKLIHIDRRPPRSEQSLVNFFKTFGVSEDQFKAAERSFEVQSKLRRAQVLARQYNVPGVPYFLINYKHQLEDGAYGSEELLFNVWSQLPYKDFQ